MRQAGAAAALPAGRPVLFLDASAPFVQVGLWQDGGWLSHCCVDAPALEAIFRCVREQLAAAAIGLKEVAGFVHNEGPGSVLGIRLAAMALRVWGGQEVPLWAVRSLPLVAAKMALLVPAVAAPAVISEFRQGLWNWFEPVADDPFGETICVIETDELAGRLQAGRACYYLRHRKSWAPPPGQVLEADSDLSACAPVLATAGLLRKVAQAEAFLTRPPEFKKTDGERHRGAVVAGQREQGASAS